MTPEQRHFVARGLWDHFLNGQACATTTDNQTALPCQPECDGCQRDYAELTDIVLPAPHEQEEQQ